VIGAQGLTDQSIVAQVLDLAALAVPAADSAADITMRDVIGNKLDTIAGNSIYARTSGIHRTAIGNYNFTDDTGAQGPYTIFTVTGDVFMEGTVGVCKALLDSGGAATVELGIAGNTAALIVQTLATNIDTDETWQDATPTANPASVILLLHSYIIAGGADVIFTIRTADLTAGSINFYTRWAPLSLDGNVVAV
jgi:hypothetical protein